MPKKPQKMAVFPLENALLFPNMILPMHILDEKYVELIEYAMKKTKKVAITLKKPGFETEPLIESICCIGTITYSKDATIEESEGKAVVVSGIQRGRVKKINQVKPFIIAEIEPLRDTCSSQTIFRQCKETLPQVLMQYLFLEGVDEKDMHLANLITDPAHIADFVAFYFIENMYDKMSFLETTDVCKRCENIKELLEEAIEDTENSAQSTVDSAD